MKSGTGKVKKIQKRLRDRKPKLERISHQEALNVWLLMSYLPKNFKMSHNSNASPEDVEVKTEPAKKR